MKCSNKSEHPGEIRIIKANIFVDANEVCFTLMHAPYKLSLLWFGGIMNYDIMHGVRSV